MSKEPEEFQLDEDVVKSLSTWLEEKRDYKLDSDQVLACISPGWETQTRPVMEKARSLVRKKMDRFGIAKASDPAKGVRLDVFECHIISIRADGKAWVTYGKKRLSFDPGKIIYLPASDPTASIRGHVEGNVEFILNLEGRL